MTQGHVVLRNAAPRSMDVILDKLTATGAVLHVYERAGDLRYGEVEVGQDPVILDGGEAT